MTSNNGLYDINERFILHQIRVYMTPKKGLYNIK